MQDGLLGRESINLHLSSGLLKNRRGQGGRNGNAQAHCRLNRHAGIMEAEGNMVVVGG